MAAQLTGAPAVEPVCLADAKEHLKVDHLDEDHLIVGLLAAARQSIEGMTGLALITQAWSVFFDAWPDSGVIELPIAPVQSVSSVTVFDGDGTPNVVDPSSYTADLISRPSRVVLRPGSGEPSPGRAANGIAVDLIAGYAADGDGVPEALRLAILRLAGHWYDNRHAIQFGAPAVQVPLGVTALLAPYRRARL